MANIWVLGLAKDCDDTLGPNIAKIENFFTGHNLFWAILESNSRDDTRRNLEYEAYQRENFYLLSEPLNVNPNAPRTKSMAKRRNALLKFAYGKEIPNVEAICVVDLDLTLRLDLDFSHFVDSVEKNFVICAHQAPVYYDIFALRYEGLMQDYYGLSSRQIGEGQNPFKVLKQNLLKHQRIIGKCATPLLASSAFGGMAIYPKDSLLNGVYQEDNECEHVSINLGLGSLLDGFIISPDLRIERVREHTRFSSGVPYVVFSALAFLPDFLGRWVFRLAKSTHI